ncbi:sulfotransferase domain-containing protein [Candidatus Pelagibacter sp.]|jgi:hypothetical protein|nr:sulfotransferase domain-containing protein [Candidatus Pelagibacter sp.]
MRVIIHLGYPRTGTTFLQKNVFPLHKQINLLGPVNYQNNDGVKITQNDLSRISMTNNEYDLDNKIVNKIDKDVIQYFDEKKINIISTEAYTMFQNAHYNFRDLRYLEILLNQKYENVQFDFLIVLRNQYDLIKSLYYFNYHKISELLKIKNFKLIIDSLGDDKTDKYDLPLNRFLRNYDFYHLNNKLLNKFNKSNIKYLFYEDFMFDKKKFSNELSNFLEIEKNYTLNLFKTETINSRKTAFNKDYFINSKTYKFLKSKTYLFLKDAIPFKKFLKKIFINYFVYSNTSHSSDEERIFQDKIKSYYRDSNLKFFNQVKINNKFDY